MASYIKVYNECSMCKGTAISNNSQNDANGNPIEVPCPSCEATGYYESGRIDATDVMDKINDCLNKLNDIKEVVDEL